MVRTHRGLLLAAFILLLLSGCQNNVEEAQTETTLDEMEPFGEERSPETNRTKETDRTPENNKPAPEAFDQDAKMVKSENYEGTSVAQAADGTEQNVHETSQGDIASVRENTANEPAQQLSLMQLTLNDHRSKVVKLYGMPVDQFEMNDGEKLTVYDYGSFLVGFDSSERVKFVNVGSAEADPGLNGLRLGSTVNEALDILGKPAQQTDYVLNYSKNGVVLKLDIDPQTETILSFKLFAE